MPENKQQEEFGRQLYAQQQKARMAQKLPFSTKGELPGEARREAGQPEMARTEQQMASQLAQEKAQTGLAAKQKVMAGEGAGAAEAVAEMGGEVATDQFLKQCWLNLVPSLGLTLIYINIHCFLRYLLGIKLFCSFGQGKAKKIMIMFLLDVLVLFAIFAVLVVIVSIINLLKDPLQWPKLGLEAIKSIF